MRRMIRGIVEEFAERIYECSDGGAAFELYEIYQPDYVLMDIELEQIDGLTAARQIKAEFADAKIVFVTNHADENFRRSAHEAGAVDYILKENLLDIVPIIQR